MSRVIKKLSLSINNRKIDIDFGDSNIISLGGSISDRDTIIYTLERFFANDFGTYYNDIDSNLGVNYANVEFPCSIEYSNSYCKYTGNRFKFLGHTPSIHCIRYINNSIIRSFILKNSKIDNEIIGVDMTKFNSGVSDSKWKRLALLVNNLIGSDVVNLDLTHRSLFLTTTPVNDWSEEAIKFVYLLVSESIITPEDYIRVILLSHVSMLSSEQLEKLIDTLKSISKGDMVVLSDRISQATYIDI